MANENWDIEDNNEGQPQDDDAPEEDPRARFRRLTESVDEDAQPAGDTKPVRVDKPLEDTSVMSGISSDPEMEDADANQAIQPTSPTSTEPADDPINEAATKSQEEWEVDKSSGITPPPPLGSEDVIKKPRVDADGMPLPGVTPEMDLDATQVSEAAFTPQRGSIPPRGSRPNRSRATRTGPQRDTKPRNPQATTPPPVLTRRQTAWNNRTDQGGNEGKRRFGGWGCLLRLVLLFAFAVIVILGGVASWGVFKYRQIVSELPDVAGLRERASQFETTRILDRNGNVLYEILDPNEGRRNYVPLANVSPYMVAAIVSTEDGAFYDHPGVNYWAIVRAFYQNYTSGEVVSGASTITQQLARTLLFTPEEATTQSYDRKLREALLALEITRRYSKDEILELYLNEVYFGNLAYGVEAASETYFNTTADKLTLTQASFLAGLPQAPSVYDVYTNPDITFGRQRDVLRLMYETSQEQGCIYVSNSPQRVCVELEEAAVAAYALEDYDFPDPDINIVYPHWVNYIRTLLEKQYDSQTIYRSGFTIYTTLDPDMQAIALATIQKQLSTLTDRNVQSSALVAIDPHTGQILAMVGSADYYNEDIDGQINMAVLPRQPGSSIKPLTYVAAFEKGWTPSTLIWDVRSEFPPSGNPDDPREPYIPVNYDERYHGPVLLRTALANSYNLPAVKTLNFVGIYQEGGLIDMARRLGITTLTEDYYGLSLTLGGGEVTLLEMTSAYSVFANGGAMIPPVAITRITDFAGNVVYEYEQPGPKQLLRPEHAYLITNILSDNVARTPSFGPNSVLNTSFPAAAKTGTTNDFRDNWTLGYTPDIVVGVWVGNPDFTPMVNTSGLTGAAPIWAEFTGIANNEVTNNNPRNFSRPNGLIDVIVCNTSGAQPSEWCDGGTHTEIFAADQPPKPANEDLWQEVLIDTWTRLRASTACSEFVDEKFAIAVDDEWGREWLLETNEGRNWLDNIGFDPDELFFVPQRSCTDQDPQPEVRFVNLNDGDRITDPNLPIVVVANGENFFDLELEWADGVNPNERDYKLLKRVDNVVENPTEIYEWDLSDANSGKVTLRLRLWNRDLGYAEKVIVLDLDLPEPTEPPTAVPSDTPVPSATPTETPTPTNTPIPPSATNIPPSNTPMPPTATPTLLPEQKTGTVSAALTATAGAGATATPVPSATNTP